MSEAPPENNSWSWLRLGTGLTVGLALCVGLILHLDVREADWRRLLYGLSWPWVVVIALLTIALWGSGARKWALWAKALHGNAGKEPAPGFFFRHFAWQNWFGQFMPPSLAIILGRSWATRHMPDVNWRAGAGNAFYDQLMEFALLTALLPAAVLILWRHVDVWVWAPVAVLGLLGTSAIIFFLNRFFWRSLRPFMLSLLAWSALRVLLTVARLVVAAPALGLAIEPVVIAAAAPVVALLFLIPLTPGNLGVAEWGWAGLLAFAGTEPVSAGLLALGTRLLMLVVQSVLIIGVNLQGPVFGAKRKKEDR